MGLSACHLSAPSSQEAAPRCAPPRSCLPVIHANCIWCTDLSLPTPLKKGLLSMLGLECLVGSPGRPLLVSALCPPEAQAASWRGAGYPAVSPLYKSPTVLSPQHSSLAGEGVKGPSTEGELRRRLRCGHGMPSSSRDLMVTPSCRPCLGPLSCVLPVACQRVLQSCGDRRSLLCVPQDCTPSPSHLTAVGSG